MSYRSLKTAISALFILVLSGCLNLSDGNSNTSTAQTQLYAYFQLAGSIGCYGDPTDTTLLGKTLTTLYTLTMADENTMMVCATVSYNGDASISPTVLADKTINFYVTNTAPTATGTYMDLTAQKIPVATSSTTTVFYVMGTTTPCPDGSSSKLLGYLDMTSLKNYKYVEAYDGCAGQMVGSAQSPLEAQRQIDRGGK